MCNLRGFCNFLQSSHRVSEVTQSCPTLCDPMDYSLPGSSVHGIFQARVLERVAISFSRGSSRSRDWTRVSRIAGRRFTVWATREAPYPALVTPWTVACQAPLSTGILQERYWSELPFPSPGDLLDPEHRTHGFLRLLHWQSDSLLLVPPGKPRLNRTKLLILDLFWTTETAISCSSI